ncbi:MAG: hypothetical protein QM736_10135 [Vicinamibacterales bacterium]
MPPRYAYWTILIDGTATAFRAKEREELLPTLNQLRRKNDDVALRYFARGKLWDSPEQAEWAGRTAPRDDSRGRDWRPGGEHKDPRARFDKPKGSKPSRPREERRAQERAGLSENDTRPPRRDGWRPGGSSTDSRQKDRASSARGSRLSARRVDAEAARRVEAEATR